MNSVTWAQPALPRFVDELFRRQRTLAIFGCVTLALSVLAAAAQLIDFRTIDGVDVWVKPAKFHLSVAVFALTTAWFFGYVRPERRRAPALRTLVVVLIGSASFELLYISWQAAHVMASHFNRTTTFYEIMYALMGLGAALLVGTTLPLAWEIARRPAPGLPRDYIAAVVIGLVLCFLLGGGFGAYMSQQLGHSVGAADGHLFLFGWTRRGGDLRIAHFLGIHAQQAIPAIALAMRAASPTLRWSALLGGTLVYTAISVAVFSQAVAGHALLSF